MLENWFAPISLHQIVGSTLDSWQLGARMRIHTENDFPSLKGVRLALIGIGDTDAHAIRSQLYPLSFPFEGLKIADLGNIRNDNLSFLIPVLTELLENRILPIVVGNDLYFGLSLYKAAAALFPQLNLVMVDAQLPFQGSTQDERMAAFQALLQPSESNLFHLSLLGYQTHFAAPETVRMLENKNFDLLRLGMVKANLPDSEPFIRDGDLVFTNINAIKQSEAPGQSTPSPGGLTLEEACQLSRYAGMSDKLKAFGLFGFRHEYDNREATAQVVSQILWYFIDGFYNRKGDFPASLDGLVEYIVELKQADYTLTFWKSPKSGRWWIQAPVSSAQNTQRHRLIPCSYADYKLACQDELPDRLINAFKRFF